jgi:hypothetical protein
MTASQSSTIQSVSRGANTWLSACIALMLPFTLVAGLLTFPTSCACGAELPHDHGLFTLHRHDHHDHSAESDRARTTSDDLPESRGAAVHAPSSAGSSAAQLAVFTAALPNDSAPGFLPLWPVVHATLGRSVQPESPPPQI